jgi:hypothetical protein
MKKSLKTLIITVLILITVITPTIIVVRGIIFNKNCAGYLKQAADANTVELSLERITKAIEYAENNGLTYGYTSIIYKTEEDNVEFWYKNLKACQKELEEAFNGTQLEKSNVLMKVRESLTDNRQQGTSLTLPNGISRYPYNTLFAIFVPICFIFLLFVFFKYFDIEE